MGHRRIWKQDEIDRLKNLASDSRKSTYDLAKILNRDPETIRKCMVKHGIKRLSRGRAMELNYFWRGGRRIDKDGYILVKCPGHPYLSQNGYIREHRLIMEIAIGRYLLPSEIVHHKDKNRQHNELDNLYLYQSNAEHLKIELAGKIPAWTAEGKAKILESVRTKHGPNPKLQAIAKARPPRPRTASGRFAPANND